MWSGDCLLNQDNSGYAQFKHRCLELMSKDAFSYGYDQCEKNKKHIELEGHFPPKFNKIAFGINDISVLKFTNPTVVSSWPSYMQQTLKALKFCDFTWTNFSSRWEFYCSNFDICLSGSLSIKFYPFFCNFPGIYCSSKSLEHQDVGILSKFEIAAEDWFWLLLNSHLILQVKDTLATL